MKVLMHVRSPGDKDWKQMDRGLLEFPRLPIVGEFIKDDPKDSEWYRVELVLHIAHAGEHIAELYCMAANDVEELQHLSENG